MRFLHFEAASGIYGRKLLPTVALAIAAVSCVETAGAQEPIPVTIAVSSVPRQTLKGIGASEPLGNATVVGDPNNKVRDQLMDLTFGDLKMKAVRLWANLGPAYNHATPRVLVDPMDAAHIDASVKQFTDTYITSGYIDALKKRGVTTFLLGPSYPTYQTSLPPDAYARRIAAFIKKMNDGATDGDPATPGVQINATGLINEPRAAWTPAMILQGIQTLQTELHRLGLDDVAVIGPETSNSDAGAVKTIQALKNDAATWNNLSGIATHSYSMAANDEVASLVTGASGASTKDWWITEVGKVNAYGNDDVSSYEAPSSTSPLGTRAKDTTGKQGASLLAARFLNDMNHGVTHWIWFVAYGVKPLSDENNLPADRDHDKDGGQKLVHPTFDAQSKAQGVLMRPKYWVFKQLRDAFPDGTVFRRAESSLDEDMLYSYNKRAHVGAAAGKAPDGSWRIGVLNLTPVATDPTKITRPISYAAAPYAVTLKISDLSTSGPVQFAVTRSQPNGEGAAAPAPTVTAVNGQITLTVQSQELVTLSSTPVTSRIP